MNEIDVINLTKEADGEAYRPCYICLCNTCAECFCRAEECGGCTSESEPVTTCADYERLEDCR